MELTPEIYEVLKELQSKGLRLGQIFENIRYNKKDLFYLSDAQILVCLKDLLSKTI